MSKSGIDLESRLCLLEEQVHRILDRLDQAQVDQTTPSTGQAGKETTAKSIGFKPNTYARVLKSFANPLRITILAKLNEGGKYNSELGEITGLSSAQLNFHLATLASSGLMAQEAPRGRYLITDLGRQALSLTSFLAEKLENYETVELDRYCPYCGKARMKVDVYPTHFQGWCPECSHQKGWTWTETGVNSYGAEWRNRDLDDFVDEGWDLVGELLDEAIKDSRCVNCSAKMEYKAEEDAIRGKCYSCGNNNCKTIKYVTSDVRLPLWREHKTISQKVEGPLDYKGERCWKASITTPDGYTVTQYRKTRSGEVIEQMESPAKTSRDTAGKKTQPNKTTRTPKTGKRKPNQ